MPTKTWSEWTGEQAGAVSDTIKHASENRLVQEAVGVAAVGIATALAVGTRGKWAGAAERLFPKASELLNSEPGIVAGLKEVGVTSVEKPVGSIVSESAAIKLSAEVEKIAAAPTVIHNDDFVNSVRANLIESAQLEPVGSIEKDFTLRKVAAIDSWPGLKSVDVSDGKALIHPDAKIESLNSIEDGAIIGPHATVAGTADIGEWNQTKVKGFLDAGASVGEGTWIGENTYVATGVKIGSEGRVGMNSKVLADIGDDAEISAGVTIGRKARVGDSVRIAEDATVNGILENYAKIGREARVPTGVTVYEGESVANGAVAVRDYERELTGNVHTDEWLYQQSEGAPVRYDLDEE